MFHNVRRGFRTLSWTAYCHYNEVGNVTRVVEHPGRSLVYASYADDNRGRLIAEPRDGDGSRSERRNRRPFSTDRDGAWCYDAARCTGHEFGSVPGRDVNTAGARVKGNRP